MSAIAALAVGTDSVPSKGTTSPVAHSVERVTPQLVSWTDGAGAIYALNKTTVLSWRLPTAKSKVHRIKYTFLTPLDRPVTDAGSNTTHIVAGSIQANIEIIIPTLATSAERVEFYRRMVQTLLDAHFVNASSGLNFPY